MEEQEIAAAIGWMMVVSGALAVMLSSVFPRHGYEPPPLACFLLS